MDVSETADGYSVLFFVLVQNKKADDGDDDEEEVLDEETKKKDQIVKGAIDGLIREYATELNAPSQDEDSQRRKRKKEKKEEVFCHPRWLFLPLATPSSRLPRFFFFLS